MRRSTSGRSLKLGLNRRLKHLKSKCGRVQLDLIRLEHSDHSSYEDDRKEFGAHFPNVSEEEEECVGQVDQEESIKRRGNGTLSDEYLDFANIDGLRKKHRHGQDNRSCTASLTGTHADASGDKTVSQSGTLADASGDKIVSQSGTLADASGDKTVSQSGTLADASGDKIVSQSCTLADASGDKTVSQSGTLADASDDKTVSQSGTLADASDDKTVSQSGTLADASSDKTVSQSGTLADASGDKTISQSGTLTDTSDDKSISQSGTLAYASDDDQTVYKIQDEVHKQEQNKYDSINPAEKRDGLATSKLDKNTETRHRCGICRRTCSSFGNLKRHMYIHTEDKPFSCSICQKGFIRRKRLKEHLNSFHEGLKPYSCDICNLAFSLKHNLKAHMNYHLSMSQYICCLCNKHFKFRGDLSKHIKRVHNEPLEFGKNCQKLDQDDLITQKSSQHEGTEDIEAQPSEHSTENFTEVEGYEQNDTSNKNSNRTKDTDRPEMEEKFQDEQDAARKDDRRAKLSDIDCPREYKHKVTSVNNACRCEVCHKTFTSPHNLKRHMYLHDTISRYTCTMCGKGFARKDALHLHISSAHLEQKAYECDSCSKKFATRQNLEEHKLRHSSVKNFPCSTCGKRSKTKSDLTKHIKRKHPEKTKAHGKSERVNTSEDKTVFTGNEEDEEEDLKHESDELHQCKTCDKVFAIYGNLRRHLLTHSQIKPFVCSVCGQEFTRKEGLQVHIYSVHTGYRPYICNVCPKTFTTRQHLNNHVLCHSVERTFLCVHCNKGFKTKSNLSKHVKRLHSSDKKMTGVMDEKRKHVCVECNRRYTCRSDLKKHTKASHVNKHTYICVVCKKDYKVLKCFEQHEEMHRMDTDNVYECTDCMSEFIDYDAMKNHVERCSCQN